MNDHAEGYGKLNSGMIIKPLGENGQGIYAYKSELSEKYSHLFRTINELNEIVVALNVAENTYNTQSNGPKLAYFIWSGAIVRLFRLFSGNYLIHNRACLDKADVKFTWTALKKHRDSDLTHNGQNQESIKFGFFVKEDPTVPLSNRIKLNPYFLTTSYPPFDSAHSVVISLIQRILAICSQDLQHCSDELIEEMCDKGEEELIRQHEFEIVIKESTFRKNYRN